MTSTNANDHSAPAGDVPMTHGMEVGAVNEQTPPPQGKNEQQSGQQRPTLEELEQQAEDLAEQIRKHLGRGRNDPGCLPLP